MSQSDDKIPRLPLYVMESRQLRYFYEVSEAGSVTAAAERLRIAQPALSRQITTLENDLGLQLFVRGPGGVTLTDSGHILRRHVEAMRLQAVRAREELLSASGNSLEWIVFGTHPLIGNLIFGAIAEVLSRKFPNLKLGFVEGVGAHLLDGVANGSIDLALTTKPLYSEGIEFRHLISEQVYLVAAAGKSLPEEVSSWQELGGMPLVVTNQQKTISSWVEDLAGLANLSLNIRYRVGSAHAALDIVQRGLAYGIMPQSALQDNKQTKNLVYLPMRSIKLDRYLTWLRDREAKTIDEQILELISAEVLKKFPQMGLSNK